MPVDWAPQTIHEPRIPEFTPEEIERYASYHWLQVEGEDGKPDAHVWRTIGGACKYLGLADYHIAGGREPDGQRPMFPSLSSPGDATHYGTKSGQGGNLNKIEREEVV